MYVNTSSGPVWVDDETGYDAVPYDNLGRLADKLFGASVLAIDNVTADLRIKNAINDRTIREINQSYIPLPQDVASWLQRNLGTVLFMSILAASVLFIVSFVKR